MSTEEQYKSHFGPHVPGMKSVPFGNLEALEKAITPNTVAFFIEPIQGEAGIRVPPGGFLAAASRLCKKHNVLLIVDEIQTGLCRTGAMFCHQHSGITPDLMTLGKALGGGVYPVSAVVGRADVLGVLKPGDHGSTFGGNAIAAAVSLKAIELLSDPKIAARSKKLGDWAIDYLRECTHGLSIVTDIRGKGLFIGVEIDKRIPARVVVDMLKGVGVLTKDTHGTTIRLAPPLTIKRKDLHTALAALVSILIALD
jgi:ornithine--oxo-acid transaminase